MGSYLSARHVLRFSRWWAFGRWSLPQTAQTCPQSECTRSVQRRIRRRLILARGSSFFLLTFFAFFFMCRDYTTSCLRLQLAGLGH